MKRCNIMNKIDHHKSRIAKLEQKVDKLWKTEGRESYEHRRRLKRKISAHHRAIRELERPPAPEPFFDLERL